MAACIPPSTQRSPRLTCPRPQTRPALSPLAHEPRADKRQDGPAHSRQRSQGACPAGRRCGHRVPGQGGRQAGLVSGLGWQPSNQLHQLPCRGCSWGAPPSRPRLALPCVQQPTHAPTLNRAHAPVFPVFAVCCALLHAERLHSAAHHLPEPHPAQPFRRDAGVTGAAAGWGTRGRHRRRALPQGDCGLMTAFSGCCSPRKPTLRPSAHQPKGCARRVLPPTACPAASPAPTGRPHAPPLRQPARQRRRRPVAPGLGR